MFEFLVIVFFSLNIGFMEGERHAGNWTPQPAAQCVRTGGEDATDLCSGIFVSTP